MSAAAIVLTLLAASATSSLVTVLAAGRSDRSLTLVTVLVSACLLALGWYDWQAQPSIETDIKAYVLVATLPIAITAFTVAVSRRRKARTLTQWAIGTLAFSASSVAVLSLSLLFNWITI